MSLHLLLLLPVLLHFLSVFCVSVSIDLPVDSCEALVLQSDDGMTGEQLRVTKRNSSRLTRL